MGKYYVAGIPFDSENSLKHYGVKGMEWNKHKFGIDADDRYIKWLKNAGQNIGRFGANVAQNVAKGVTNAARTAGTAVNKGANFVTGNQNRQQYQNQSAAARTMRNPQQAQQRATNYYNQQQAKTLPGIAKTAATSAANTADKLYRESGLKGNVDRISNAITGNTDRATAQSYRNLANFQEDQNAPFRTESPKYSPENLRKEADKYQRAADTALIPSVQRVAGNVGNAVSSAARDVGNWAGQTAQNIGNSAPVRAVGQAAQNVGNTVGQAAQNVGNAVSEVVQNAGQSVGNFVDQNITGTSARNAADLYNRTAQNPNVDSVQRVMNQKAAENAQSQADSTLFGKVGNTAQNVGSAVSGAANKATEGAKGFLNSAGQWVSGAANNVKNTASKAASDAKKGASGFLNSAGQWVSNAASNVKNAAQNVGNTVGQAAQNVGNTVGQAAQNVGNTVGQAAEQARGGIGGFFDRVGNAVGGAAQNVGNWAGNAAKDVGNAVSGAANAVGDWAGNAAQNVGGAVQNAGNWVGDRARDVNDWYTGGNKGEQAAQLRDQAARTQAYGDRLVDAGVQGISDSFDREPPYRMSPDSSAFAQNAKDQSKVMFDKSLATRNRGFDEWDTASDLRNQSRHLQDAYDAAPRQQLMAGVNAVGDAVSGAAQNIANAVTGVPGVVADWARNAAGNVGNAVSGVAGNAADWARNAAGNVGNWAGQAAQNVGNFVSEIANPHYQLNTQQMVDNYRQYLNDHPENPQSPQHSEWLREQVKNDPQLRDFYEQYMKHSAIDEKPDGVSDAFWEKFTADGGTREEYDRDWR